MRRLLTKSKAVDGATTDATSTDGATGGATAGTNLDAAAAGGVEVKINCKLGIKFDGGKSFGSDLYVTSVTEGGNAHATGKVRVGLRIRRVNGTAVGKGTWQTFGRMQSLKLNESMGWLRHLGSGMHVHVCVHVCVCVWRSLPVMKDSRVVLALHLRRPSAATAMSPKCATRRGLISGGLDLRLFNHTYEPTGSVRHVRY